MHNRVFDTSLAHLEEEAVVREQTDTTRTVSANFESVFFCCCFFSFLKRRSQKKVRRVKKISAGEFFQVIGHFQYSEAAPAPAATVLENGGSALQVCSAQATQLHAADL